MAEFVFIYDSLTGGHLTKPLEAAHIGSGQVGSGKLADAVILSSHVGSGQLGGPHFRPGGTSGNVFTDQGGAAAPLFAAAAAGLQSGQVITTHIASGGLLSGALGSGSQDLGIVATRRPWGELGQLIISGIWAADDAMTVAIPSGMAALEVVAAMIPDFTTTSSVLIMQFNGLSGGLYHRRLITMGPGYATGPPFLSTNYAHIIPDFGATTVRNLARATVHGLGTERHSWFTETANLRSGVIASAVLELAFQMGYYDDAILLSGLAFWGTSGAWRSGSVIKVLGTQI